MLTPLNTQLIFNTKNFSLGEKFQQNSRNRSPDELLMDERANLSSAINTCAALNGNPVNSYSLAGDSQAEIDQYIDALFQSTTTNTPLAFKQEDSCTQPAHLTDTDTIDSGFSPGSAHSSPQLSPQLSPMSNGSYTRMEAFNHNTNSFGDKYQLTFQGAPDAANWALQPVSTPPILPIAKEIKLFSNYPSKSALHNCELRIVKQPEQHHRARYMTEGSRGTIKDSTGRSYPIVQLMGYNKGPVRLQCFIGHDQKLGDPHLFYQACEVSGKTAYRFTKVDGTNVIELDLTAKCQYQAVIDCMGILKERNVDVERKMIRTRRRGATTPYGRSAGAHNPAEEAKVIRSTNKSRSSHCRIVFRCLLPYTGEVLQVVSDPILCTQPLGSPEIFKVSLKEMEMNEEKELFVLGRNFHKDTRVLFSGVGANAWRKVVEPIKEVFNSTHLVCKIPTYDGPNARCLPHIPIEIMVYSEHKNSDPVQFTYINSQSVRNALDECSGLSTALNGQAGRQRGKFMP